MAARYRPVPARLGSLRAVFLGAVLLGVIMGAMRPAEATVISVTSLTDFNTAVGSAPTTSDPFDNDIAGGLSITFDSGVVSSLSGGFLGNPAQDNQVSGGTFLGEVDGDMDSSTATAPMVMTWTFPNPVIGFGLDFAITGRLDAAIVGSGQIFDIGNTIGGRSGFFGLVDTMAPFTQVQFTVDNNFRNDLFNGDNLIFAAAPIVLPEPGTLALFALGLGSLALIGYRKRRTRA